LEFDIVGFLYAFRKVYIAEVQVIGVAQTVTKLNGSHWLLRRRFRHICARNGRLIQLLNRQRTKRFYRLFSNKHAVHYVIQTIILFQVENKRRTRTKCFRNEQKTIRLSRMFACVTIRGRYVSRLNLFKYERCVPLRVRLASDGKLCDGLRL